MTRQKTPICALLLGTLLLCASSWARATADGQAAFERGNEAFRSGDFATSLVQYEDALLRGKDTARLFYNMGLAHLRLGQLPQARSAFLQSLEDPELAALSSYQLGALAYKDGDRDGAEAWFERALRDADSPRLRAMSLDALDSIGAPRAQFESYVSAGFGHDSNAYRAPRAPYVDYSADTPTPIVPIEQSGAYVPLRIRAAYLKPMSARTHWLASYRHRGDYYTDQALNNANVTDHRLALGLRRYFDAGRSRTRQMTLEAVVRSHGETNFDRDDGLDRFDDGTSIADRFDFLSAGLDLDLRNYLGRVRYELDAGLTQRNYENLPTASSYDLQAYWAGATVKIPLTRRSRLELGYTRYVRDFDERRARDATGDASSANPTLEYRYGMLEAGIRHRFSERVVTELVYSRTARKDQFVGYNDYERDRVRLDTQFDISEKLTARLRIDYRDQQYPNAFAFDEPSQPPKEYDDLEVSARFYYRVTDRLSLKADVENESVDSSDPRGAYDRLRTDIGLAWSF